MLTKEELDFIEYWKVNRDHKKTSLTQFTIGIPLAVLILLALFINIATGWYTRAAMVLRSNSSLIIIILIAAIGIFIFITLFSIKYKWEQNEQRYRELLYKKRE